MKFLFGELDGQRIAYTDKTEFKIQSRFKNKHDKYETKCIVTGDLFKAVLIFNSFRVIEGKRKRLFMEFANKPVLIRSE